MGWFYEQIKDRKKNDNDMFADSFVNIAGSVMGKKRSGQLNDRNQVAKRAIDEILKFYSVKAKEVPDEVRGLNEQLEYLLRPNGIMRRSVTLTPGWHKQAVGAMLTTLKAEGTEVALIPAGLSGYKYFDAAKGCYVKVNSRNEALFDMDAISFYKPFPLKKMTVPDLIRYMAGTLAVGDFVLLILATVATTVVGMFMPRLNHIVFSNVATGHDMNLFVAITVFMLCVVVSTAFINAVKSLLTTRMNTKMSMAVQAATMMRVLSLPPSFFKEYGSGELSGRAQYINSLCDLIVSTVLSTGLTSLFSLAYVSQIFVYAPALVIPALVVILVTLLYTVGSAAMRMRINKKTMELSAVEGGMSYAMISGIQKIKLSGSEKRLFARWGNVYAKIADLTYNPPILLKISATISAAISLTGTIVMYYAAVTSNVSVADYYAFNTAYALVAGSFMSLAGVALSFAQIKPVLEMAKPLLDTVPEVSEGKEVVTRLHGGIELNNVTFRYVPDMKPVLEDVSLKISSGQYVAIVGKTGCGKSTLMRLMLGFETPQKGAIYFDGKDLKKIDLKSLRRKIGVVMQNGKLFSGDIFSNITISAPWLSLDEAWEAAEMAGVAEDIRRMPMGMHTIVAEGGGGISGGQKQRLMIARAIAPKPRLLMLDEATSALDNITQKIVSDSLDSIKCTRIVIAHRLSTIRQCDRIIVLDGGKIIEDGSYDELLEKQGAFYELIERQRVDMGNE